MWGSGGATVTKVGLMWRQSARPILFVHLALSVILGAAGQSETASAGGRTAGPLPRPGQRSVRVFNAGPKVGFGSSCDLSYRSALVSTPVKQTSGLPDWFCRDDITSNG